MFLFLGNDRDSYLRELELQIAEQKARKEMENKHKLDWWEKPVEPQFQVIFSIFYLSQYFTSIKEACYLHM